MNQSAQNVVSDAVSCLSQSVTRRLCSSSLCLYLLQIITMTHCSCFLCQTCFKTFFTSAIKEKSIDQLICPQCGKPEIGGHGRMEESMEYFNLLDTQVRGQRSLCHTLPAGGAVDIS